MAEEAAIVRMKTKKASALAEIMAVKIVSKKSQTATDRRVGFARSSYSASTF